MDQPLAGQLGQQFGSDNYAGICPEAWTAMTQALGLKYYGIPGIAIPATTGSMGIPARA